MARTRTPDSLAGFLSLVLPGAGQLYHGNPFSAALWFGLVLVGYIAFILPGVLLHLFCIADAIDPPRGRWRF